MSRRVALITGASSGIGQAISHTLNTNEWNVIGPTHTELDLNDLTAVSTYAAELKNKTEHLDALIHVAGIWHDDHQALADKKLAEFTPAQITTTMHVGLVSAMLLTAALLPIMQNDGTVLGISGTFESGAAGWLPYYTGKRAIEDFLVGLSQDYPKLQVYGISPSDTATPAYRRFYPQYIAESQSPEVIADLALQLILGQSTFKSGDIVEIRRGASRVGFHV